MRRTTKTGRYAKIAASAVVVLLFGLVTSTALADDSPFSALPGDNPFSALGGDNGFSALDALTGSTSTSTITTPTVSSDKGDYAPGELVTLRGTNWHPGEAVHIHVNDDLGATWERDSDVVADESGEIVDSFNLPNWFVASYSVVAIGAESGPATASFTDANVTAATVDVRKSNCTTSSTSFNSGDIVCAHSTITATSNGNSGDIDVMWVNPDDQLVGSRIVHSGAPGASFDDSVTVSTAGDWTVVVCTNSSFPCGKNQTLASQKFTVAGKTNQTISFTSNAPSPAIYGGTYTPTATATSGLSVAFGASGACSYNSGVVTFTNVGSCIVTADQAGNTQFNPAPQKTQQFTIGAKTISGSFTAASRVYDRTTAAAITGRSLNGVLGSDDVTLTGGSATFADKNVGSAKTVTATGFSLSGAAASRYTLASTTLTTTASITSANVSVQFAAANKPYDGTEAATISTRSLTGVIIGDTVTVGGGTATFADRNVGTGKTVTASGFTLGGADGSNYAISPASASANADITPLGITGSFESANKTYDATTAAAATSQALSGVLGSDEVSLVGGTASFANKNVGTDKVVTLSGATLAGADAGNYTLSSVAPTNADIMPLGITGNFTAENKVYDGNASATVTGRTLNDTISGDTVSLVGGTASFANKNVGTDKVVTLSGATLAGADADNYTLELVATATANITPKPITVAADDKTKVYGSADPALTVTVPAGTLESGDSLSGELERATGKDVGSYAITRGSLTAGGNYELTVTPGTLTIAKKAITVSADDKTKVYGSADPALTVTVPAGTLESGDSLSGELERATGKDVGSYAITQGSLTAGGNYELTVTPGTLTITQKAATVSAVNKSKVYGSDDPELTTTDSGFLAADLGDGKITFSASRAAGESVAGGPYTITPSASDAATSRLGNYDVTYNNGQLTITKKPITGSFKADAKVYDGNTDAVVNSRDLTGLVGDDAVSLVGGSAAFDTKNAGTAKTVTLTDATLSGADAGNYSLESVATAKASITPKPITLAADDKTKVYGSADPALTVTVPAGALETGDSLSGSLERADGQNVGAYAITKGSLTAGGNYELTVTPGTLTITKKEITVSADDKTKVYGSADPALTVTVPNGALETGDSLSGSLERADGQNVGAYAITKGSLTAGGNYELTVTPGTLTITKKEITVTGDDKTKVIGAADPALTYKVTSGSLETGDSFSGALTRSAGEAVGMYEITQGTLTAGANYAITFEVSILKIVYGWDGFLQPINDTAHQTGVQQSKFKLGQTIPAKFLLKNAAGAVVRQATDPTFSRSGRLGACDATATADTTDVVTADAGVAYAWDGSQYHYNWSTKGLTGGEYRIYANLADGTKQYVDICLAK